MDEDHNIWVFFNDMATPVYPNYEGMDQEEWVRTWGVLNYPDAIYFFMDEG